MSAPVNSVVSNGDAGGHTHHWMIERQDGPSSDAACKECGERRTFLNGYKRGPSTWAGVAEARARLAPQITETSSNSKLE